MRSINQQTIRISVELYLSIENFFLKFCFVCYFQIFCFKMSSERSDDSLMNKIYGNNEEDWVCDVKIASKDTKEGDSESRGMNSS